jgi:hypothetical protein
MIKSQPDSICDTDTMRIDISQTGLLRRRVCLEESREASLPLRILLLAFAILILSPVIAPAQGPSPAAAASDAEVLKPEELEALIAPVALYPDTLLSLVLMAST